MKKFICEVVWLDCDNLPNTEICFSNHPISCTRGLDIDVRPTPMTTRRYLANAKYLLPHTKLFCDELGDVVGIEDLVIFSRTSFTVKFIPKVDRVVVIRDIIKALKRVYGFDEVVDATGHKK